MKGKRRNFTAPNASNYLNLLVDFAFCYLCIINIIDI